MEMERVINSQARKVKSSASLAELQCSSLSPFLAKVGPLKSFPSKLVFINSCEQFLFTVHTWRLARSLHPVTLPAPILSSAQPGPPVPFPQARAPACVGHAQNWGLTPS